MFSLDIIIMEYYQHIVRRKMYVEFRAIGTNLAGTFQRTDRVLSRALRFPIPPMGDHFRVILCRYHSCHH